jgi:hypothetical protein
MLLYCAENAIKKREIKMRIKADEANLKILLGTYEGARKQIEDEVKSKEDYYSEFKSQETLEKFGWMNGEKREFLACIKDFIILINEDFVDKEKVNNEKFKKNLKEIYNGIIQVLKNYCDIKEEYYPIISIWIIGTYFHREFQTYPYLFFNAMRGSGKTRILNLIAKLSKNGKLVSNMSEAVLFRTASNRTICMDEVEEIGTKEKSALRELLNSAYKKGMNVERIKKVASKTGESYVIESFDVFCPIALANIWGSEDILSDRCITLILEKSAKKSITRLIESFDTDTDIKQILSILSVLVSDVYDGWLKKDVNAWNQFVKDTDTTDTTYTTNTTNITDTQPTPIHFFNKINQTTLEGRNLELFFPLFIIAEECNVLDQIILIAEEIVKAKKTDDISESRDVSLLSFLSMKEANTMFIPLKKLVDEFKETQENEDWVSCEWVGRAMNRLGLIIEKRRMKNGREIIINFNKAKEKIKMFK